LREDLSFLRQGVQLPDLPARHPPGENQRSRHHLLLDLLRLNRSLLNLIILILIN
jgi:hypothetical protein